MKHCPMCDRPYSEEASFCEYDGATLNKSGSKEDPFIGKTIAGKYRVLKKLGAGGMGAVYLAEQMTVGRKVALKVLHREFATDEEFTKRFHQEARLAASLNHRHVITIHDFDQADDGSLFIAMEYVEGNNLKSLIHEGPLNLGQSLRLARQIAEGLSAAHRSGVIHRDIKPENIMIVQGPEEVKLMDFGISRLRDAETVARLTRPGMIMGTPAYMAPEQIEGREVNEKTDIYAFGVVLFEMLSGASPFKAPTPTALLMKHINELPVPLRKLRADVPTAVERLVMQALEKKPERRQADMEEVVAELRRVEGVLRDDVPRTVIIPDPRSRKKRYLVLTTSLVLVIVGGLILVTGGGLYWNIPSSSSPVLHVGDVSAPPVKLTGSGPAVSPPPAHVVSLVGHGYPRTLHISERRELSATAKFSDGMESEVKEGLEWESSDATVLNVSAKGEVEALKNGRATVAATYRGFKSEPISIEIRGKGAKEARPAPSAKDAPQAARLETVVSRHPSSVKQPSEAPAASVPAPEAAPLVEVVEPRQPPSVQQPPEAPAALSPDPGKVIADYIRGEKDRGSKGRH